MSYEKELKLTQDLDEIKKIKELDNSFNYLCEIAHKHRTSVRDIFNNIIKHFLLLHINKILLAVPLIITYLIGPIGLFIYWIIRIFYAKRMSLYE